MSLGLKTSTNVAGKTKLSTTLKSWLPILQSNLNDLEGLLDEFTAENPFVDIKSKIQVDFSTNTKASKAKAPNEYTRTNMLGDKIEGFAQNKDTLHDVLYEQIAGSFLFPTTISQNIANEIIENLNHEGYFEGDTSDIAKRLKVNEEEVKKIRQRFAYIKPYGIAALDIKESFKFQLEVMELEDELHNLISRMIDKLEMMGKFKHDMNYQNAMNIIKTFKNPPAIDYMEETIEVIPDIFIMENDGNIVVSLNSKFYPDIIIEDTSLNKKDHFIKNKLREARDLIDALDMRKATIYKIGTMILEYQYEFFMGGEIKPMRLQDLADEFGHSASTISRAINSKYLECSRGIIPIKSFFTKALDSDGNISNTSIKDFIEALVKEEDKKKPLSDAKILDLVTKKFDIKMVRRTITKYRKQLNIASSSERKKIYETIS